MANKTLFKSLIGKLIPATDAVNEERAPAYALSPKHQLAQYAATGCLNTTFYATADEPRAKLQKLRRAKATAGRISCGNTSASLLEH
jgi:60 kDa SS-A/Ro ribonucleoprotein